MRRKETRTMDILAGRLTRAMRADMADNEARLVSLAGERFSQSAIEEVGTYDIDNLRARAEAAEAEVARLTAWLLEADSAFNLDGAQSTNLDECAGLVRMCCEGRAAIDQVARLREALELAAQFVAKAHADGAYDNTAMSGERALRLINAAHGTRRDEDDDE